MTSTGSLRRQLARLWVAGIALLWLFGSTRASAQQAPTGGESADVTPPRGLTPLVADRPDGTTDQATVVLELIIANDGEVQSARVVEGVAPFTTSALGAVPHWRFEPARRRGVSVAARVLVRVDFPAPEPSVPGVEGASDPLASPAASGPASTTTEPKAAEPIDVVVHGARPPGGTARLTRAEVRELPGAFGDPFRAVEAMPGVSPTASGVPEFFVRGAPPSNTGYFLDTMHLPALFHAGLGPAVVHPGLIESVTLYPGGAPAHYGRFVGAIVEAKTLPPSARSRVDATVRLFDSAGLAEGVFNDGKTSALLAGRISYTGPILSLFAPEYDLRYSDYQARLAHRLTERDRLTLLALGSSDTFVNREHDTTIANLAFHRALFSYEHDTTGGGNVRCSVTTGWDRTRSSVGLLHFEELSSFEPAQVEASDFEARAKSLIARVDVEQPMGDHWRVRAGADGSVAAFDTQGAEREDAIAALFPARTDLALGAWVSLEAEVDEVIRFSPGLRSDMYASLSSTAYTVEPRAVLEARLAEKLLVHHTLALVHQPPSFATTFPGTQVAGLRGGLQKALQYSTGAEVELPEDVTAGLTGFYNVFFNVSDALSMRSDSLRGFTARVDARGMGKAMGMEMSLRRRLTRRLAGLVSYTLSSTRFSVGNERFDGAFDRRHVLQAALMLGLGRGWRTGFRAVYITGTPNPAYRSIFDSAEYFPQDSYRTPERLPSFHRWDARLEKKWGVGNGGWLALVFEVQNATLQREVVEISCSEEDACEEDSIGPITLPTVALELRL